MADQQNVGANLSKLLIKETGRLFQMKRNMEGYLQHRLPRPSVLPDISIKIAEGKKDLGSIFDDIAEDVGREPMKRALIAKHSVV